MPDPLTIGELRAIHAIVWVHAPADSRQRLCERLEAQIRALPEAVTNG